MRLRSIARGLFAAGAIRRRQDAIVTALAYAGISWADRARIVFAEASFNEGDYQAARRLYAAVGDTAQALKARQMIDWIDYKHGIVDRGWPAYPGVHFTPDPAAGTVSASPARIDNPNQPHALVRDLGLAEWDEGTVDPRPVLVWFNFKASLGGEILAARVVRAFQRKFQRPLLLAVDPRLRDVVARNFPGTEVISREGDLASLRGRCGSYLLARDALRHVVAREEDFAVVAAEIFSETRVPLPASSRPRVALSWKTTNRDQGLYRNIPLEPFARLLAGFDFEYHSAQHGIAAAEKDLLSAALGSRIRFDVIVPSSTVSDLASQLRAMDAVVTIDNSVLHIAGAFDVPTFGLLSVPSYWAWPLAGSASRWYRSVTLIHQQTPRVWAPVLADLGTALAGLRAG